MTEPPEWLVDAMRHLLNCRRRSCLECIDHRMRILATRQERHAPGPKAHE